MCWIAMKKLLLFNIISITLIEGLSLTEWRPLGQGDPLIDPTHVYSPPMVEHVHYWLEPHNRPRVELPPGVKGTPPIGFAQVHHHHHPHQRFPPQYTDNGLYRNTNLDQYSSSHTPSIHQNHMVIQNNNPSYTSPANYQHNQDSIQSITRTSFTQVDQQIENLPTTQINEKLIFNQYSTTIPPTSTLPETHMLSLTLEPPPPQPITLGQVAGWPQISTHLQPNNHPPDTTKTLSSSATTSTAEPLRYTIPSTTTNSPTTTTTIPTTTKASTTSSPVSFVIEGHSKVKKYGPLPETANSIYLVNHNHLISKNVCDECIDLPKAKEIANPNRHNQQLYH